MIKTFLAISAIMIYLYADPNITNTQRINPTVAHNIPDEVDDTNKSRWNSSNWAKNLSGGTDGAVGNTLIFMNNSSFLKKGMTTDTSELTTEAYNSDANASAAASGYTDDYRATVMSATLANTAYSANANEDGNTLKCFMARDLPFRYKCEETGLVYGGSTIAQAANGQISNMDGMSGKEALNLCKENCKRQADCLEAEATEAQNIPLASNSFYFDSNSSFVATYPSLNDNKNIKYLTFELNTTVTSTINNQEINQSKVFLDISYVDKNDKTIDLIKHAWIRLIRGSETIDIRSAIKSIEIELYSEDTDAIVSGNISNVSIKYEGNTKYICAALQNVSEQSSETFAYICPNGNLMTFGAYQICSSGVLAGDNSDGTYSDKKTCNNICNISKKCTIETGSFDATIFEQMREGRLGRISADGQYTSADSNAISSDIDCTNARASKQRVVNEVSFDAKNIPYQTVLNGTLVPNVDRPRVMSSSNLNYETQKKEEWKDSAYQNMLQDGTYSSTVGTVGEDTQSHFAYSFNLADGSNYGSINTTSRREFKWKLKPNALFYNNNISYKLYCVLKVDAEKYGNTINGTERLRDQIWYIKTSEADTFIPFIRAENYAAATVVDVGTGNIKPTLSYNASSSFDAQTFSGSNWTNINLSIPAPSFKTTSFLPTDFWYEFKIFDSIGDMIYKMPGLIRSSTTTNGGVVTNDYSGSFNGTGDGVAGYEIYTFFSDSSLSYQDIKNKINAIDTSNPSVHQIDDYGAKIYKTLDGKNYDKFIRGENLETNSNIEIYQYGASSNNSLKVRIKPRKEDVGKNGFVYIFVY